MVMRYSEFVEVYEQLSGTSKKLEKTEILSEFLKKLKQKGLSEWIYLLHGRVVPEYDAREMGISRQLAMKSISKSFGVRAEDVLTALKKSGDLGELAERYAEKTRQSPLFSKVLDVEKVFSNLKKVMEISGKGTIDKKMGLIAEILGSASGKEAKYFIRTLVGDLRVGVAEGILREAIVSAFLKDVENASIKVEEAYGLCGDFAEVLDAASSGISGLKKIKLVPGKPTNVMLAVKAENIEDGFRICGKPAAFEYKYDGFRLVISKNHGEIKLFTRRLEEVTNQFPDVVKAVEKYVNADSFIIDSEAVGYDRKTGKYTSFQHISQRIKRKYEIEKLVEELPVELNVFDVLYYNGEGKTGMNLLERRALLKKIIKEKEKVIILAKQLVTDDAKKAEEFYKEALKAGEEGVMIKNINVEYLAGRRVGNMAKLKPNVKDLDLVIVGAEYGTGKRGGWLTSFIVACRDENGEFLQVGKVSSGLKEKEDVEGTSYEEMTNLIKPLISEKTKEGVNVKPKLVVSVTYQDIQKSPSYSSGYAMRFPRISAFRPDRNTGDIASLNDIEKCAGN